MKPKEQLLEELVIEYQNSFSVKGDTLVYRADAFKLGNEEVVEDLLKKIPGISVDVDGKVKVGNQEVEKLLVDGEDFFGKGYQLVTKNMPVNPIENVEVLRHYVANKHMRGIENSDRVALNLSLKNEAKSVVFGNLETAYGVVSENRFEVRANAMLFGAINKWFWVSNLNNIGKNTTGDLNQLIRPNRRDDLGSVGANQSAVSFLGLGFITPNLKAQRVRLNNAEMTSLSQVRVWNEKIKSKMVGFFNTDDLQFFKGQTQDFAVGDTRFSNSELVVGQKHQQTGFGKIDLEWDISDSISFVYTFKYNRSKFSDRSDLIFNDHLLMERQLSNNQLMDHKAVYTQRLPKNKVLQIFANFTAESTPQHYAVNAITSSDLFRGFESATNSRQFSENKMEYVGTEGRLKRKTDFGHLMEFHLGMQLRRDRLKTALELFEASIFMGVPEGFKNQLNYQTQEVYVKGKYQLEYKKWSFWTQVAFHLLENDLIEQNISTKQTALLFQPTMGAHWKVNANNTVKYSYALQTSNAAVGDVYSGYIQKRYRMFGRGLGDLNQVASSNVMINYTYGNISNSFLAHAVVMYAKNHEYYSSASQIAQNYVLSEKKVLNNQDLVAFTTHVDRFVKPIKTNLKLFFGTSQLGFKNFVNSTELRDIQQYQINYGGEIRSGFNGWINFHLGANWRYTAVETTSKNSFTNHSSFLDLFFVFSERLQLQLLTERYVFGNLNPDVNTYYFLDAEVKYEVPKLNMSFALSANNLLNVGTFRTYNLSNQDQSESQFRLMPRYLLMKAKFNF